MKYIVFGAGGFIGKGLSYKINSAFPGNIAAIGNDLSGLDIVNDNKFERKIDDFNKFSSLLCKDTEVVYLLNTISPVVNDISKAFTDNEMLLKYLEWAKNNNIKRTIFTSSGGTIYKNFTVTPISENSLLEPLSLYGMSKLTSELYLKYYKRKYDLDYTILRISNPYGPGQKYVRNQGLIPYVIECANQGSPVNVIGDGSMTRDYIYIDDLIESIVEVLKDSTTYNKTLNVGSGKGVTILEVIESIEKSMDISISKSFLPNNPNLPHSNVLDISQISTIVGWQPKVSFSKGIDKYIQSI